MRPHPPLYAPAHQHHVDSAFSHHQVVLFRIQLSRIGLCLSCLLAARSFVLTCAVFSWMIAGRQQSDRIVRQYDSGFAPLSRDSTSHARARARCERFESYMAAIGFELAGWGGHRDEIGPERFGWITCQQTKCVRSVYRFDRCVHFRFGCAFHGGGCENRFRVRLAKRRAIACDCVRSGIHQPTHIGHRETNRPADEHFQFGGQPQPPEKTQFSTLVHIPHNLTASHILGAHIQNMHGNSGIISTGTRTKPPLHTSGNLKQHAACTPHVDAHNPLSCRPQTIHPFGGGGRKGASAHFSGHACGT